MSEKRIMGLDLGKKRIGVAVSDPLKVTAQPITVIERSGIKKDLQQLAVLFERYRVREVVLGYPVNMNGSIGPAALEAERFKEKLVREFGQTVHLWDERLSTVFAEKVLIEADMKRDLRRRKIDKVAATIILQSYLDARLATEK
ncbi:MAG: Holliday junction resolvase RuvX [Firmicutes bacterium]|jgi:putative Holliday junction resolvase|nr:Holliday junction resolvase RuvX [Bacillota bacterium]